VTVFGVDLGLNRLLYCIMRACQIQEEGRLISLKLIFDETPLIQEGTTHFCCTTEINEAYRHRSVHDPIRSLGCHKIVVRIPERVKLVAAVNV
jgi:hypothetical protein